LHFLGKGFGKNKIRTFSASVLVCIKYFFVSANILAQGKVRLF